jgi:hypothetical protein
MKELNYIKSSLKNLLIVDTVIETFDTFDIDSPRKHNFIGGLLCDDFRSVEKFSEVLFEVNLGENKVYMYHVGEDGECKDCFNINEL